MLDTAASNLGPELHSSAHGYHLTKAAATVLDLFDKCMGFVHSFHDKGRGLRAKLTCHRQGCLKRRTVLQYSCESVPDHAELFIFAGRFFNLWIVDDRT